MSDVDLPVRAPDDEPEEPARRRWGRWAKDVGGSVLAVLALWFVIGWVRGPSLPDLAPPLALTSLAGTPVDLAALRGQTVVVNFWATWCPPCRVELPELVRFAAANPDVPVIFVAMDGTPDALRAFAGEHDLPLDRVVRADEAVARAYGASTLPTTVVVNPEGEVRTSYTGMIARPWLWAWTW